MFMSRVLKRLEMDNMNGCGVKQEYAEAARLYRLAAE
jgi:hypothetical protein